METGAGLSCAPTQGNRLSCRDQEGRRGSEDAVPARCGKGQLPPSPPSAKMILFFTSGPSGLPEHICKPFRSQEVGRFHMTLGELTIYPEGVKRDEVVAFTA